MRTAVAVVVMAAVGSAAELPVAPPPRAAKPTRAEAERRWADYWVEVAVTAGGKPGDPAWYWGRSFVPDTADGSFASWLVMGEAVLSPYPGSLTIDVTTDPMRVDLVHTGRVVPGIFRFDGDDLVWVTPREFHPPAAFGCEPMARPTDFTSTAANGHVVRVLRRAGGLYGVEPVGPAPPAVAVAPSPRPAGPTPAELRKRFYRGWLEVERVEAGVKTTDPNHLSTDWYSENGTWGSWGRRGELSSGTGARPVRFDPTADPMRLDLRVNVEQRPGAPDRIIVHPCIVRFDGDRLVIAWPAGGVVERELKPGEDYAQRPKDFTSTKRNGARVSTYRPCYPGDQD